MLDFLLNHSVHLIGLIAFVVLGHMEYKRYLEKNNQTPEEFRSLLRLKVNEIGNELLAKLVVSIVVTFVISIVSFRELWMNDAFHIVFLTNLVSKRAYVYLRRLFP